MSSEKPGKHEVQRINKARQAARILNKNNELHRITGYSKTSIFKEVNCDL